MKTYKYAGVSRLNGKMKVRWANDADRVKVLVRSGHRDIDLIEMSYARNKRDALSYLLEIDFDNGNAEVRATIEHEAKKRGVAIPAQLVTDAVES